MEESCGTVRTVESTDQAAQFASFPLVDRRNIVERGGLPIGLIFGLGLDSSPMQKATPALLLDVIPRDTPFL